MFSLFHSPNKPATENNTIDSWCIKEVLMRFYWRSRYHTNGMGVRQDVRDVTATDIQLALQIRPIATFACKEGKVTLTAKFMGAKMGPTWGRQDPGGPCRPHEHCYMGIHICYSSAFVLITTSVNYQTNIILCDTIQRFLTKQLSFLHRAVYWHECDFQETLAPLKWCVSNPVMPVDCKCALEPATILALRILDIHTKDDWIIHSLNHVYIWHVPPWRHLSNMNVIFNR